MTIPSIPQVHEENKDETQINPPNLDAQGKPTQRAVTTAAQAYNFAKRSRERAREGRLKTAAVVQDKYNAAPPFDPNRLASSGQGWRNNFSTDPMGSVVDRATPQLLDPINRAEVLTHSILPPNVENGAAKSRTFQTIITKTIRAWPEWEDFCSQVVSENTLHGCASPARTDQNWRPKMWNYDEAYLPTGTGQHARTVPMMALYQPMLIHDFCKLIENSDLAQRAGYNIEGCRETANKAAKGIRSKEQLPTEEQDAIRELANPADSLSEESHYVHLFHVLVQDYTGEVDLWTVDADDGTEIRQVQGLHKSMEDATTLFTIQAGNKKYYGSKGLGRKLCNIHIALDRGRNLGADQMYLSGLVLVQVDNLDTVSLQCKVRHPFVFLKKGAEIQAERIQFNHEAFLAMDNRLVDLMNAIAGAFIPTNLEKQGSSLTKIEAAQDAERDIAIKQGVLARFDRQMMDLISSMQRLICSPTNLREAKRIYDAKKKAEESGIRVLMGKVWSWLQEAFGMKYAQENNIQPMQEPTVADEEAVAAIVEMLEAGLSCEEIVTLALSPAKPNASQEGADKDNRTLAYIANNKQNPFVNQREAAKMEARLMVNEDRANQLIIDEEDPTIEAIATRQQIIEFSEFVEGDQIPVAKTDNHKIHRKVLAEKLNALMQVITGPAPTPELVTGARLGIEHYRMHLGMDMMTADDIKAQEDQQLQVWEQALEQVSAEMQQQAAASDMPVPVKGQPPQVGTDGNIVGEDPRVKIDAAKTAADIELRNREAARKEEELKLNRDRFEHDKTMDDHRASVEVLKLQQSQAQLIQDEARRTQEEAMRAAEIERQNTPI